MAHLQRTRRLLLLLLLSGLIAGCGGHRHRETANDVAQRVARASSGHVAGVTCTRAGAKWWRCQVTEEAQPNSLGTSSEELLVRAR